MPFETSDALFTVWVPNATRNAQMSYYLRNAHQSWSSADDLRLRLLAAGNTPTRVIAFKLGRSAQAVQTRAAQLGISLKPVNQSPYNRRPK
jgi:hypothetical protein